MGQDRSATLTRDFRIAELLARIDAAEMVLPEFQRDYDWGDDRVIQLLATVIRRWPAGSLLLQEFIGETFFRLRKFEGGPEIDVGRARYVVLDGQQRLTALYHAVYGAAPSVFAIRAKALQAGASIDDLEDNIQSFTREEWNGLHVEDSPDIGTWIPFSSLRSAADFFLWRDEISVHARQNHDQVRKSLSAAYRNGLESFHTYTIPAVIVERELEPAAIARIFERVNRAVLTLQAFDLMVAKTFEPGWNLRERWEQARLEYPLLDEFFADDGMTVIRLIAMKTRNSVREADVLGLPGPTVRTDWYDSVSAVHSAIHFLHEECGVQRIEWLPYGGLVLTLAGLASEHDLKSHRDLLVRWFLSRSFGLRYDSGANTVTVDEYHHLRSVVNGERELTQLPILRQVLRDATRKRRSALWRSFLAALSFRGALDPITGEPIDQSASATPLLERELDPPPGRDARHLLVMNLLLTERGTRRRLQFAGLNVLRENLSLLDDPLRRRICKSQLLPLEISENPEIFLERRLDQVVLLLEDVLGHKVIDA